MNKLIKPDREPDFVFVQIATHSFWFKEKIEYYEWIYPKLFKIKILKNQIMWLDEKSKLWMNYGFNEKLLEFYKKWLISSELRKKLEEK